MRYRLLLLDVDGTVVPVGPHTRPSDRVKKALAEAKKKVGVSLVSGRCLSWLVELFEALDLTDPSIINGGSQIVDPKTGKVLWERSIKQSDLKEILNIIHEHQLPFIISDDGTEHTNPPVQEFKKPLAIKLTHFDTKKASDDCLDRLRRVPDISAHKTFSWDKNKNYKMEIYITHKEATKEHAIEELAKMLKVDHSEIVGIGDARNDMPLLNICGLKIAMGNADDKLKDMAHYIAPSVEEDGVADAVEKFILASF